MTKAKYFGRMKDGHDDLIRSKRSLSHCAGLASRGRSPVCLRLAGTLRHRLCISLDQSVQDVVHRPCALAQVGAKRVTEIVRLGNLAERLHPALETAVYERAVVRDSVDSISATRVLLFTIRSMEDNVEVDQIELGEGGISTRSASAVEVLGHDL